MFDPVGSERVTQLFVQFTSSECQSHLVKFASFQNIQICDCQNDIEKEVPLQADIHEESHTTDGVDGDLGILRG